MPYALMLVLGGFLTLAGMRGCEYTIDKILAEPKKQIEKEDPKTGLKGETIKNALVFTAGGLAVVGSVYITKKFFTK